MLRDIQRQFMLGILDGQTVANILPPSALSIYANNARVNFTQTLERTYPALSRLVGADYFRQCAHDYQSQHPSRRGDLQHVGEHFSSYLSKRHGADEYSYLADVAALEWAYQEALIKPELPALDVRRLTAVEPRSYVELRFRLQSSAHLVESRFPVLAIWQANVDAEDETSAERIDLASGGDRLLLARGHGKVRIHSLSQGEFIFLTRLLARDAFASAVEDAGDADPTFDPIASLQRFVALRAIVDFYL